MPVRQILIRATLIALTITVLTSPAKAVDRVWFGPVFGGDGLDFDDPLNWNPSGVPGSFDRAVFGAIGDDVRVTGNRTLAQLLVVNGVFVEFDITPTGSVHCTSGLGAGTKIGSNASLSSLAANAGSFTTDGLDIGVDGDGQLIVRTDSHVEVLAPHALVGDDGALRMSGGSFECQKLLFDPDARFDYYAGSVTIDGALLGGELELPESGVQLGGDIPVPSTLLLRNSTIGRAFGADVYVGDSDFDLLSTLRLQQFSWLTDVGYLRVGGRSPGQLLVESKSWVTADQIQVGGFGGSGDVFVCEANAPTDGQRSRLDILGTVGEFEIRGEGRVFVQLGGRVTAAHDLDVGVGAGTSAPGLLSVAGESNGAPAEVRVGHDLNVGDTPVFFGTGRVELYDGGLIDVAGSTIVGDGDVYTQRGGTLRTGSIDVRNPDIFDFTFTNGLIEVISGTVTMASGVLSADGFPPSDDPLLHLRNNATADVTSVAAGLAGIGRMQVSSGAALTATNGNFGLAPGSDGELEITEQGTSASIDDLGIGSSGTGRLTVGDRASLTTNALSLGAVAGTGWLDIEESAQVSVNGDMRLALDGPDGTVFATVRGVSEGPQTDLHVTGDLFIGAESVGPDVGGDAHLTLTGPANVLVEGETLIGAGDQLDVDGGVLTTRDLTSLSTSPFNGSGILFSDGAINVKGGILDLATERLFIGASSFAFDPNHRPLFILSDGAAAFLLDELTIAPTTRGALWVIDDAVFSVDGPVTLGGSSWTGEMLIKDASFNALQSLTINPSGIMEIDDRSELFADDLSVSGLIEVTLTRNDFTGEVIEATTATPGGEMSLVLDDAFAPLAGSEWRVLSTTSLDFSFDNVTWLALDAGTLVVEYGNGGLGRSLDVRIVADITGDIDLDGSIGFSDLGIVLAGWGDCPANGGCPGDLDDNGEIGFADLATLLAGWG